MKTIIHKINWKARYNKLKTDLSFEVTEQDCYITKVSHNIANWMLNQPWIRCYGWLRRKYADITSEERIIADGMPQLERNPRRLSDKEWLQRLKYIKD